jgi:ferredoxin
MAPRAASSPGDADRYPLYYHQYNRLGAAWVAEWAGAWRGRFYQKERVVPHVIAEPCIGMKDGSCVEVCPVDCIHPRKDEPGFAEAEMLYIEPDTCIDCGLCVDECPVKAIFPEEELPAQWRKFIPLNVAYYHK